MLIFEFLHQNLTLEATHIFFKIGSVYKIGDVVCFFTNQLKLKVQRSSTNFMLSSDRSMDRESKEKDFRPYLASFYINGRRDQTTPKIIMSYFPSSKHFHQMKLYFKEISSIRIRCNRKLTNLITTLEST